MKKLLPFLVLSSCFLLPPASVSAQDNIFSFGLNHLTHGEVCSGGLPRSETADVGDYSNFLMSRFRLNVGYRYRGLEAKGVIQNSAVWGSKNNLSLNLYEGWVRMTLPLGEGDSRPAFFAQLGRVALTYDDERIIGPNDFAMASKSHDILRLGFHGYGHQLHAIIAYNQNGSNVYTNTYYVDGAQPYKTMQALWYHYDIPVFPLGASLLFINTGMQAGVPGNSLNAPRIEYQQLLGGYLKVAPRYLDFEASYYRQWGNTVGPTMEAAPLKAWMASAKATVKPSEYYGFKLGYDHLSGDDYVPVPLPGTMGLPRHTLYKGFTPLYGSRTQFYGIMDYFYQSAYINGFTPGLQNAFVGAFGKPFKGLSLSATYHYLAVATTLRGLEPTLGHSVELEVSYRFSDLVKLTLGYTQMAGTETMQRLKQTTDSRNVRWGWFSLEISPNTQLSIPNSQFSTHK